MIYTSDYGSFSSMNSSLPQSLSESNGFTPSGHPQPQTNPTTSATISTSSTISSDNQENIDKTQYAHKRPILHKSTSVPSFSRYGYGREYYMGCRTSVDNQSSIGSLTRSMSKYSDSDMSSNSSDVTGYASNKSRKNRRVTFSPEVTVAEVIDRFERRPRTVRLSEVPAELIAPTMAY